MMRRNGSIDRLGRFLWSDNTGVALFFGRGLGIDRTPMLVEFGLERKLVWHLAFAS
jgi:hypothetical protein